MSTTLIIVIAVAVAIVLLALFVLGGRKRKIKKKRIEAGEHRSEAQIRRQRAERELADAREHDELARRVDPDVDLHPAPAPRAAGVAAMGGARGRGRSPGLFAGRHLLRPRGRPASGGTR
jgi:Flp pilus assembly protein TadB